MTTLTSICAAVAAVGRHAPNCLRAHPEEFLAQALLLGMAASLSPGILGFMMLLLAAPPTALGLRREVVE